jgi:hypothetical protein
LSSFIPTAKWSYPRRPTSPNKAVFYSSASLLNNSPLLANDVSRALITVKFTLTETVDYAFSGSFKGILDPTDTGVLHDQTIQGGLAAQDYFYAGTAQSTSSGLLSLPKVGDLGFSSGGPLTAGSYEFSFIYDLVGGAGNGEIQLTLSSHPEHPEHPHVPDTGSTLTLLGTALLGIALVRHRATASPC